jgi:hypothetical protein
VRTDSKNRRRDRKNGRRDRRNEGDTEGIILTDTPERREWVGGGDDGDLTEGKEGKGKTLLVYLPLVCLSMLSDETKYLRIIG